MQVLTFPPDAFAQFDYFYSVNGYHITQKIPIAHLAQSSSTVGIIPDIPRDDIDVTIYKGSLSSFDETTYTNDGVSSNSVSISSGWLQFTKSSGAASELTNSTPVNIAFEAGSSFPFTGLGVNNCSPLQIDSVDFRGNISATTSNLVIDLIEYAYEVGAFFSDVGCTTPLIGDQITITSGNSSAVVYYKNTNSGWTSSTIEASAYFAEHTTYGSVDISK